MDQQSGPTVWNGDPHSMEKQSGMETHTVSAKNGSLGVVQGWDWCWLAGYGIAISACAIVLISLKLN